MKKHTLLLFIALLMGVMSCLGPTKQIQSEGPAGRYYVKMDGNDEADGTSWETAFFSLQKALESAGPGYEIWVAAGSYKPTKHAGDESLGDGGRDNAFVLRDSVAIYGGFPATGNPGMDERDWKAFETILSGDIGVEGDIEDNAFHVLIAVNVSDKTLLDGFVITGGNASFDEGMPDEGEDEDDMGRITVKGQPISGENGGGMYNRSSSPTLHNLIFRDNKARLLAGGIYSTQASSPALYQVSLTRNSATWGGGMYNSTGAFPVLSHVSIYANKASWGGGMYNKYCSIVLTDVSIKGNVAEISGGGMGCFGSLLLITHTEIDGNTSKGHGGGLELQNSYPVFINVTIRGNEAQQGGGMNTTHSGPFLANVLISGNRSAGKGGGIHYYGSSGSMMNTTISGNMAGEGGGIFARANNFQHFSLYNTLVFGNSSGIVVEESKYPVFRSFSLIQGISAAQLSDSGEGNIDANQMTGGVFVAPASPEEAPTTKGDYRLAKGSAAINKGYTKDWDKAISYFQGALDNLSDEIFLDNAGYKHFLALREKKLKAFLSDKGQAVTDLKGNPRVAGAIDIGAYEYTGEERANAGQEDIQQEGDEILADGGHYFTLSCEPVYDADWSEVETLSLPQINTSVIEGKYAEQCNHEIRDLYEKLKKDHDAFYAQYENSGHGPEASYKWAVREDVLSLRVLYEYSGWAVSTSHYKFFNLNIRTGQPVGADALVQQGGLSPEDIQTAIERANNEDRHGVLEYKDAYHYRNLHLYLDEEGLEIYVLRKLNMAAEIDEYLVPFRPSEWLHKEGVGMSMQEAVDMLAKLLNDPKLKYMWDDEKPQVVKGEDTYYINAHHDMGTHIVTFGHFYVGCRSGKIYINDIVKGEIVPYDPEKAMK